MFFHKTSDFFVLRYFSGLGGRLQSRNASERQTVVIQSNPKMFQLNIATVTFAQTVSSSTYANQNQVFGHICMCCTSFVRAITNPFHLLL